MVQLPLDRFKSIVPLENSLSETLEMLKKVHWNHVINENSLSGLSFLINNNWRYCLGWASYFLNLRSTLTDILSESFQTMVFQQLWMLTVFRQLVHWKRLRATDTIASKLGISCQSALNILHDDFIMIENMHVSSESVFSWGKISEDCYLRSLAINFDLKDCIFTC